MRSLVSKYDRTYLAMILVAGLPTDHVIDRIRTWARAKAHGPSPLSPVPSRSDSRVAPPSPLTPTSVSGGHKKEQSDEPSQHAHDDQEPEKRHVLMRFVLAVKAILFSSIINVLLVFVPVGIAVREF